MGHRIALRKDHKVPIPLLCLFLLLALRITHRDRDLFSIRRPLVVMDAGLHIGKFERLPAVGSDQVDLRGPLTVGEKRNALAVGRPGGGETRSLSASQQISFAGLNDDDPEPCKIGVLLPVSRSLLIDDIPSIRREARAADTLHTERLLDGRGLSGSAPRDAGKEGA